ncbi:MAG TPA: redoxin domain-containing protein [Solirubrobacteraceae bacterium]
MGESPESIMPDVSVLGQLIPDIELDSTLGYPFRLAAHGDLVVYMYPGASGIIRGDETPMVDAAQHRGFRDHLDVFTESGFHVVGLSSQSTHRQRAVANRHKLSHALVSDPTFHFADALGLRTLRLAAVRVYERITLVIKAKWTCLALDPLPTPESHPALLAEWLRRSIQGEPPPSPSV